MYDTVSWGHTITGNNLDPISSSLDSEVFFRLAYSLPYLPYMYCHSFRYVNANSKPIGSSCWIVSVPIMASYSEPKEHLAEYIQLTTDAYLLTY